MSYKIYDAYRLKEGYDVWEIAEKIHVSLTNKIKHTLTQIYQEIDEEKRDEFHKQLCISISEVANSPHKSICDVDVGVHFWKYEDRYYIRAYDDNISILNGTVELLEDMGELEDFHYQNHTDQPENINDEEWEERFKIWEKILNKPSLHLEICNANIFWRVDPYIELCLMKSGRM